MSKFTNSRRPTKAAYSSDLDYSSDYSDDFENGSRSPSPSLPDHRHRNKQSGSISDITSSSILTTTNSAKKSAHSEGKRRPAKNGSLRRGWRSSTFSKESKKKLGVKDSVQARMMSARRNRVNVLNNQLCETQLKLEEATKENRLLKTLQHRQNKALQRFEDTESDLPRLITQHQEDERVLRARIRKVQDSERRLESKLKDNNEEMQKMENTLRRLKKIIYDKNLGERSELAKQLASAEDKLYEAERKNTSLEKRLDLTTSSFSRQMNGERMKHRETKERLETLQKENLSLQAKLKEKERALDVSNIYAHRTKHTPERSFIGGGKVVLASPRQPERRTSPAAEALPVAPAEQKLAIQQTPESAKPSPAVVSATGDVADFRQTIKSPFTKASEPEREGSALLDLTEKPPKAKQDVSKDLNGLRENEQGQHGQKKEREGKPKQSVFLTASFESPMTSPASSFVRDNTYNQPPQQPQLVLQDSLRSTSPPEPTTNHETPLPDLKEAKRKERQEDEEKRKREEEQRKKADLLAKLRGLEEDQTKSHSNGKKPLQNDAAMRKMVGNGSLASSHLTKQEKTLTADPKLGLQVVEEKKTIRRATRTSTSSTFAQSGVSRAFSDQSIKSATKVFNKLRSRMSSELEASEVSSDESVCLTPKRSRKLYKFPREVENLHLGVPSSATNLKQDKSKSLLDDPDVTFGAYAPTIAAQPRRKQSVEEAHYDYLKGNNFFCAVDTETKPPRTQLREKKPMASASESEPDEPLLDLTSGKSNKKNDLLSQLFGESATTKPGNDLTHASSSESAFNPTRENSMASKSTPRAKPVHSGYPWEKNVLPAPRRGISNGDLSSSNHNVLSGPMAKAIDSHSPIDDDIEELTL